MRQEDYRACMSKGLKNKQFTKEERQAEFCILAKLCSEKVQTREEAARICSEPKPPKTPKASKTSQPAQGSVQRDELAKEGHCDIDAFHQSAKGYPNLYVSVISNGCSPCHQLKKLIKDAEIATPIVEAPAEECIEIADKYGVQMFPTVVRLEKGKVKARHVGSPDDIIEKMRQGK